MIPPEIEAAALIGWHVYPCSRTTKAGAFKGAHSEATADLNILARWSNAYARCNWRVVFGPSRIWGIDLDVPPGHAHDGIAAMAALVRDNGPLPPGPRARSGGGGLGLYFCHNGEPIAGTGERIGPGIDPRRGRQTQTIPPSIHTVTKRPYRWLAPPWVTAPPPAPAWLLALAAPPPAPEFRRMEAGTSDEARRRLYRAASAVANAPPGGRNATLNRRAYQCGLLIRSGLLDGREAADALYGAARSAGLDHGECRDTIKSAFTGAARGK